jgi:hypothetical protein
MFIRYKSNYFKKFIHLPYYIIRKNYTSFYVLFDRLKNIKNLSLQSKLSKFIRRPSLDKIYKNEKNKTIPCHQPERQNCQI